jgi:hypothetical protein
MIIGSASYRTFCDISWNRGDPCPKTGIIFVDLDSIPDFFRVISEDGNREKYIIVSAQSDWGLHYQIQKPVWTHLERAIGLFARPELDYQDIKIEARCDKSRCTLSDKYSVSCYSWTSCTFDKIPDNVHKWYLTNNAVSDDPRLVTIPFGINNVSQDIDCRSLIEQEHKLKFSNRNIKLYVNFQFCTKDRLDLYYYFERLSQNNSSIVVERDKPFTHYIKQLSNSQYVLCPPGNGLTCFREVEALACGALPVVVDSVDYAGIPCVQLPSLHLSHLLPELDINIQPNEVCTESYWLKRIRSGV